MLLSILALAVFTAAQEHPHEPWVFRSVLDNQARRITVALHEDLWVAYDATDCTLYRAWKGGVHFDGAVYTTVHGPQPTSEGLVFLDSDVTGWWLSDEKSDLAGVTHYRGYAIDEGVFRIQYEVRFEDGTAVRIDETPSVESDGESVWLTRNLTTNVLLPGKSLALRVQHTLDGTATRALELGGAKLSWQEPSAAKRHIDRRVAFDGNQLTLRSEYALPTAEELAAMAEPEVEAEAEEGAPEEDSPRGVAPGEIHVEQLVDGYEEFGPRERGLSLRLYDVDVELIELPQLVEGQTANVNAVIPRVELYGAASFGGLDRTFVTVVTGFLETGEGSYGLRLGSDDGSRLILDDEEVIDNDGLHGHLPAADTVECTAGLHALEIHHFENSGGKSLVLEWMLPETEEWVVIPDEAFSTTAGEVRVTSPGFKKVIAAEQDKPGDGRPLEDVHPSLDLSTVRPEDFEPKVGGMDWLSDGRLVLCTWDPTGSVYALDDIGGPREDIRVQRIAWGLAEPLGLKVVDDRIFVLQKQELTELVDRDGDGLTDEYRNVCSGWDVTANFHEFAFGLVHEDGFFYANLAIAIDPGGASSKNQVLDRGTTIRIDPSTGTFETVAWGLRTPNGIGKGVGDAIFLTDNQGDWLPVSKLLRLEEGAFYNSRAVLLDASYELDVTPPVVWLPQNEIGNSPSQPALLPESFGPYAGQMIHGEVTHGGVKRVFTEEVDGMLQGAVFRFTQGLEAGINRLSFGPDGALYVGGVGSTGNWGQQGKLSFGLQRLAYNAKPAFEMLAVRAKANGFEIEFTESLGEDWGWDPLAWEVRQWRYEPTAEYGGPKIDERELSVRSVRREADGRRLFLELEGLAEDHLVYFRIRQPFVSAGGRSLWTTEAWYTLNRLPETPGETPASVVRNRLTDAEGATGWELLFDGHTLEHWTGYRRDEVTEGWQVVDGEIAHVESTGDLVTRGVYENFELSLEWRLSHKGNSGIFFLVTDEHPWPWESGPEMQILDNDGHGDGISPMTSAGANYALHEPVRDVTRPIGQFNEARIRVENNHVTHWLNGVKLLEYDLRDADWEARVAASKFSSMPNYGRSEKGHIALQDHGDPVFFRNLKIRRL